MIELRWIEFGPHRQLEYRTRPLRIDAWGDVRGIKEWTDWKIVPTITGDEAAWDDVRASGGIAHAP